MESIIMFIVFLLTDLTMVGVFAFIYSGKEEYSEGMILGVHIPKEQKDHEEVQVLAKKYKKYFKTFNLWNFIFATLVCFLCFLGMTFFMTVWMIWLMGYFAAGYALVMVFHRKMYDLKMKYNWVIEGNSHIIHIDTEVSAMSAKLPISHWYGLLSVACIVITLFIPRVRAYFGSNPLKWILPGSVISAGILFWGLHLWMIHRKNIVYSTDSKVNMAMNRMEKRTWSVLMISTNYLNLLGWSYLAIEIYINNWLFSADYWVFIVLQMIPAVVLISGVIYMQKKRKEVLAMDTQTLIVDDDEYWKNGWYSNPNDTHLWVQDRMCSTNYSMNMAKPAAKITSVITAIFVAVVLVGTLVLIISLDNAKMSLSLNKNQVSIEASIYDTQFEVSEIKSVKMIEQLPNDDFSKTNGGETDKYLIGHFVGKQTGKCLMYLYRGYYPILEIKLKDKTIYINSKTNTNVKQWYRELTED